MRREFAKWLAEKAEIDKDIYLIVGDIGYGLFDEFRKKFPDRFINIGICEQSMISISAGMALQGLKPYVYTITPFLVERPFEQIKIDIDCNNANVKLIGYADYPNQGPTHELLNEGTYMTMFNNIRSYCFPLDSKEVRSILDETYKNKKPTFISLRRDNSEK